MNQAMKKAYYTTALEGGASVRDCYCVGECRRPHDCPQDKIVTDQPPATADRGELLENLKTEFPHGHPDFMQRTFDEIQLHNDKNHDYASGGRPLGNFERVATILSLYPGFPFATPFGAAIVYALKQLDAVMWGLAKNVEHKVEGLSPRCQDISVYFKLIPIMIKEWRK